MLSLEISRAKKFNHFISIHLERPKKRDLFTGFNTGQKLLERILLYKGKKIDPKNTLLFIDEIQHSAEAVRSLRYLYDAIFTEYIEDVEKYSNLAKATYLTHTIDRAPLYAGERITYEKFGESLFRSREIKEAFDAGLVNCRMGFKEFFAKGSLDSVYRGRISEQVVAQEIVAQTFRRPSLQFWIREKGAAETDFLYPFKEMVIPIEVKSGKTGKLKSVYPLCPIRKLFYLRF